MANTQKPSLVSGGHWRVPEFSRLEMVGDNAAEYSMENYDGLENRLKEATGQDSRQLLEEFLNGFFLDKCEVAVSRRPFARLDPELEKLTFSGHTTT